MPKSSAQFKAAKRLLSEAQLIAFLRAANANDRTSSIRFTVRDLDAGRTLEEIFAGFDERRTTPYALHIELKVKPLAALTYLITFGHHGPGYGDGGEWEVVFNEKGEVQRLAKATFWIH